VSAGVTGVSTERLGAVERRARSLIAVMLTTAIIVTDVIASATNSPH
jgi:hypothetical protein